MVAQLALGLVVSAAVFGVIALVVWGLTKVIKPTQEHVKALK